MAKTFEVNATHRTDMGKGASRRLRHAGQVPAVLYGSGEPVALSLDHNEMIVHIENEAFFAHVLDLHIGKKSEKVIVRDIQRHPAKRLLMHVDFQRVDSKKELHVSVPLHFINEDICIGVKQDGGLLSHLVTELEIACLPSDLPEFIEVDVSKLGEGETIHISDIQLPKGVRSILLAQGEDHDNAVVACNKLHGGDSDDDTQAESEASDDETSES